MKEHKSRTFFGLLRHEKTVWNQQKRIQGQKDSPLTAEGQRRAVQWGSLLKSYAWDRMMVSSAGRAMETALRINATLQIPLSVDERLQEQDWGAWTAKTLQQVKAQVPELLRVQEKAGWDFCPPGGEDRNQVWERSRTALREAASRWPGQNILVVTHEGIIKVLLYGLYRKSFRASDSVLLKPRFLHWLVHDGKGLWVRQLNALSLDT